MSILLGIDYGDKRIGLALSDPAEKLARRYLTLINRGEEETLLDLMRIVREEKVGRIVVGLPLGFRGESEQTRKVEAFMEQLRRASGLKVKTMNEALTSKLAEENLHAAGVRDIKAVLDQEAARIILQDFLDAQRRNSDK